MKKYRARKPENLTIDIIAKAIRVKTKDFHGNCYAIACKVVESGIVRGRAVYGHWFGEVAKTGYWAKRRDQPFQRHGWVELEDGRILDPTRWSFEDKEPYLYLAEPVGEFICDCEHVLDEHDNGFFRKCTILGCLCLDYEAEKSEYDEGGNRIRKAMSRPPPAYYPSDKKVDLVMQSNAKLFVMELLCQPEAITMPMVFWLGNLPLEALGPFAKDVYKAIINAEGPGIIPIDNRWKVLGRGKN